MKNTRTFIGVAVVCLVGGFTLMHWVPLLSGKQAKLGNRPTLQGSAYPGEIRAFAGQVCPAGWLAADGSELNDSGHPALVAAIGDLWESTAIGKFKLPDLRGVFIRVWNSKRADGDPEAADRTIPMGAPSDPNRKGDQVGTFQGDQFRAHHHATLATARWGDRYTDTMDNIQELRIPT